MLCVHFAHVVFNHFPCASDRFFARQWPPACRQLNLIAIATLAVWLQKTTTGDENCSLHRDERQHRRHCVRWLQSMESSGVWWSPAAQQFRRRISVTTQPRHVSKSDKSGYNGAALPPSNFIDHIMRSTNFLFECRQSRLHVYEIASINEHKCYVQEHTVFMYSISLTMAR